MTGDGPKLDIRQHPIKARMCGFSDITNRGILYCNLIRHPPLVIELLDYEPTEPYTCIVSLIDTESDDLRTLIDRNDNRWELEYMERKQTKLYQTLIGPVATAGVSLKDLDGIEKLFFVFPDLSVRTQGIDY